MRALLMTLLTGAALAVAGPASAVLVHVTYDVAGSELTLTVPEVGEIPDAAVVTGTLTVVFTSNGAAAILDGPASVNDADVNLDLGAGTLSFFGVGGAVDVGLNAPVATSLTGNALADSLGDFSATGSITCAATLACDTLLALPPVTLVNVPSQMADIVADTVSPLTAPSILNATQNLVISLDGGDPIPAVVTILGNEIGRELDTDEDGVVDLDDNCPDVSNPTQTDTGGLGAGSPPDGIGNACQCGDVNNDGIVTTGDATILARALLTPPTQCGGTTGAGDCAGGFKCDADNSNSCTTGDATIIRRALLMPPAAAIEPGCGSAPVVP